MKDTTVSKRLLSFTLALLMLISAFPMFALSAFAGDETSEVSKVWTDEDYAKLYVTDGLIFKWDAFDLEAGATVTELQNQVEGGQNITLDKIFNKNGPVLNADSSAVGTVSNGTEKNTVLGDTTAENLVADSTIDTNGAVLTTATLDFSAIAPSHKVGDVTVLDDVTLELTFFHQNYYLATSATTPLRSAAIFGPFAKTRFINDTQDSSPVQPTDASYGIVSGSTFGFTRSDGVYGAWQTDFATSTSTKTRVFGNPRLQTFTTAVVFDYTVAADATTGSFHFDYFRDAAPTNASGGWDGKYDARYCGNLNAGTPTAAHNWFWFGGSLPFAYRAIRMYSVALTAEQMAQNHAAELLDYYQVDLTVYKALARSGRTKANTALASLRLGETSKEEIESILNTDEYKAMTYNYSDLYVRDGLVYLWSGEGNELTSTAQSVTAFENMIEGSETGDITKISYGRHFSHHTAGKAFTFYKTDKGVHNNGGNNFALILTDLVPTREYNGEKILSDMTLEVSQMYPSTYQTKLGGTVNIATRNYDPGYMVFGAFGNQSYTRVAYKSEYAKNESGTLRNFVPYYYIPNAYASDTSYEPEILYADSTTSTSTKTEFPLYRKNSEGVMVKTTTDKHGNAIDNVYCTATAVYAEGATGKIYYVYDPYFNLSTKDSDKKVTINANGHIQGAQALPGIDANGMGPIASWSGNLSAYDYPMYGRPNFMNAYQDQVFTTTMIFDYDESSTATTIPYTFTAGRDGARLNTTSATYDTAKDYTPATYWDSSSKYDDDAVRDATTGVITVNKVLQKYAFSYGIGTAMTYYSIRLYDRALTEKEQAQNNFIDIAFQLDANLFDYIHAEQYVKDYIHDAVSGTSTADWTKDSLEALIVEANAEASPPYYELYVQNGLVFLWSGEGYELGANQTAFKSFNNLLGEGSINKLTQERLSAGYYKQKDLSSYYVVDKGVVSESDCKLYLTDLIPTKVYNGENILADMTLEVSQSLPLYYKKAQGDSDSTAKRNYDTGCIYLGPEGYYNYTKVSSGAIIYGGKYYAVYEYTPNGSTESETVYTPVDPSSTKQAFTLYRMVNGVLVEAEDIQNMYLVEKEGAWVMHEEATGTFVPALTTHGHRQTTRNLPAFDAYGNGPIESWSSALNGYVDNPLKNTARFLNGQIGEVFTTTVRFDYDDAFTKASAINYALALYRDGASVYNKNSTYDANNDYTNSYNTYNSVLYSDDTYTLNETSGKYEKTAVGMKYGFTYGLSSTVIYHGIRLYDRALEDHEIAQNHFIDLAFYFDANLKDYLALDENARTRIHLLFSESSSLDFTSESFQSRLDDCIAADGFYLPEGFDALLSFEGFGGRLWDKESLRAIFTADMTLVEKLEELGAVIEIGVLVAPAGEDALTVTYDADGNPTASRGALRTAYLSNAETNALKDTAEENVRSFALSLVLDDPAFTLELASELSFRAYVTVKNAKTPYTHYLDTDSELFEETISFTELYRYLYVSGYESYPVVKEIGGDLAELLDAVQNELTAAREAQTTALNAAQALENALVLYEKCRAALPETVADAYLVLTNAYTAYVAANTVEDILNPAFTNAKTSFTDAIAALESAVADKANEDTARLLTFQLKQNFAELEKTAALYENAELYTGLDDVNKYLTAFSAIDPEGNCTLNGDNLKDFILLPDENSYYAAKTLALALYDAYGILPMTVLSGVENALLAEENAMAIVFTESDNDFGSWSITVNGKVITLSGGGENGAYRAANELLARIDGDALTLYGDLSSATDQTLSQKKFAADKFLNADGTLDTEGTEPLTVAFLGGSLTELTDTQAEAINNWRLQVSNYLESVFPNREFTFYNAGIGGTTSYAGATRFYEHVGQYNPDIIFIEFTVNDQMSGYSELEAQTSVESILYQCAQLETIPSIIYTHNPYATYPDSSLYRSWMKQVTYKEEWASHYGITTINVYDYIYRQYEIAYEEGTANDFISFLDTYYGTKYDTESQYGWYDVHGGYKWYADAIIENLEANGAEMLRPFRMNAYLNPGQTSVIEASYNYVFHDSDRFTYNNGEEDGNTANDWTVYTKENQTGMKVYGENNVSTRHWEGPEGHVHGLRHISGANGAYLEFKTTASKIVVHDQLSVVGSKNNIIYVVDSEGNETKLGNSSCYHKSSQQPSIQSRPIDLKNPNGEEILIRIRVEDNLTYYRDGSDTKFTTEYNAEKHANVTPVYSTFRFGGIIEIFD